jgi:hypothetical protein
LSWWWCIIDVKEGVFDGCGWWKFEDTLPDVDIVVAAVELVPLVVDDRMGCWGLTIWATVAIVWLSSSVGDAGREDAKAEWIREKDL